MKQLFNLCVAALFICCLSLPGCGSNTKENKDFPKDKELVASCYDKGRFIGR